MTRLFNEPLFFFLCGFVVSLGAIWVLYRLLIGGALKRKWQRYACFGIMILSASLLVAAPFVTAAALALRGEYLTASVPLLYAMPCCLGTLLMLRSIVTFAKIIKREGHEAARTRLREWVKRMQEQLPTDDQLEEHKPILVRPIWAFASLVYATFALPLVYLKVAFGARFGMRVATWSDFDIAAVAAYLVFAYWSAAHHHPAVALTISIYLIVVNLFQILWRFETKRGVLLLLTLRRYQVGLSSIVGTAMGLAAAFGCVHFSVATIEPAAYSQRLSFVDSLYFSVTTFATVGYGDIYPKTALAKIACMSEIVCGCLVLLFGVGLGLSVWIQRHSDVSGTSSPAAAASSPGAEVSRANGAPLEPPRAAKKAVS